MTIAIYAKSESGDNYLFCTNTTDEDLLVNEIRLNTNEEKLCDWEVSGIDHRPDDLKTARNALLRANEIAWSE